MVRGGGREEGRMGEDGREEGREKGRRKKMSHQRIVEQASESNIRLAARVKLIGPSQQVYLPVVERVWH